MDYAKESLRLHQEWEGENSSCNKCSGRNTRGSFVGIYSGNCPTSSEIQKDINQSYELTRRWNMCLVVTRWSLPF